jgi:multidrug resistance efflux pump
MSPDGCARQAEEDLTKADRRQSQQVVRSPADGLVQQLAVYSEGAVLKAADPILVVVPDKGELIVEAQVLNRDAGFVEEAQKDEEGRGPEAGLGIGG